MRFFVPAVGFILAHLVANGGYGLVRSEDDRLLHDARAVRDAASFERSAGSGEGGWAVLRILPADESGSTGPDGFVRISGNWQRVAAPSDRDLPSSGSFEWKTKVNAHDRRPDPSSIYSPFVSGGVVLSSVKPTAVPELQSGPVFLLPDGWESKADALLRSSSTLRSDSDANTLYDQTTATNPFLAIDAVKRLLIHGNLRPDVLRRAMANSDSNRRAAIIYLVLTTCAESDKLLALLEEQAQTAAGARELYSFALGAFAAALFHPSGGDDAPAHLMHEVKDASRKYHQSDPRVSEMLKILGW